MVARGTYARSVRAAAWLATSNAARLYSTISWISRQGLQLYVMALG